MHAGLDSSSITESPYRLGCRIVGWGGTFHHRGLCSHTSRSRTVRSPQPVYQRRDAGPAQGLYQLFNGVGQGLAVIRYADQNRHPRVFSVEDSAPRKVHALASSRFTRPSGRCGISLRRSQ
jgi:hypothetical protein